MTTSSLKKQRILLAVTTIVFLGAIAGVWQLTVLMNTKKQKVFDVKEQLQLYEENKKIESEESKTVSSIVSRLATLESYRITPATTPDLLSMLETLAKKHTIEFAITTVQTPGAKNAEEKLLIDFSAKGNQSDIDMFLSDIAHQPYQIKFTKFSLFSSKAGLATSTPTEPAVSSGAADSWEVLASIQVISY